MNALPAEHQRVDGAADLAFRRDQDGRTVLADLYQRAPCRVLFPRTEAGDPVQAVLLTTSGGLTGGDRTKMSVRVGADAQATVTTQAAEKLYRALPGTSDTRINVDIAVEEHAWLEWLAQETILFDGSRLRRTFVADVAPEGRLLAVESLVFGRTAMGESLETGLLHDSWRIRRGGRLVWADGLHFDGDLRLLRTAPFGFGTAVACCTLLYVAEDATRQLNEARRILDLCGRLGAATAFDGILVIRMLADQATALRQAMMTLVAAIRRSAAGLPARLPRVWYC
jgi:urease accessory protein